MSRDYTVSVVLPPPKVPFLDQNGVVNEEWRLVLEAIVTALFGPTGEEDVTLTLSTEGVQLGSGTIGAYVATISQGAGVSVTGGQGEGSSTVISIGQAVGPASSPSFAGLTVNGRNVVADQAALDQAIADLANKVDRVTISLAETNHATPVDFAAVKTALDALGAKLNEAIGALQ